MSPKGSCRLGQWVPGCVSGLGPCTVKFKNRAVPAVPADLVDRIAVDPGLLIYEVRAVAAQLAVRRNEGMQYRITRVLGLQPEVERLPEILREEAERIGPMERRRWIEILEDPIAGGLQPLAEQSPRCAQRFIVTTLSECHR